VEKVIKRGKNPIGLEKFWTKVAVGGNGGSPLNILPSGDREPSLLQTREYLKKRARKPDITLGIRENIV